MKKRIFVLSVVLVAFTAGLTLVVMGGVSGYTVLGVITESTPRDTGAIGYASYKISTTVNVAPTGPFHYKYVKAKRIVYNGDVVTEDFCIIKGTVGKFEEKYISPDLPDNVEVEIVGCKGTNVAPIVIGSILMAASLALFVLSEVKLQRRIRAERTTPIETTGE